MIVYVRSGAALWPIGPWLASRLAALAAPNCAERAACELVAALLALDEATAVVAEREAA